MGGIQQVGSSKRHTELGGTAPRQVQGSSGYNNSSNLNYKEPSRQLSSNRRDNQSNLNLEAQVKIPNSITNLMQGQSPPKPVSLKTALGL